MDSDTIEETCDDQESSNNMFMKLNEQRKIGKYCDYTLKTEDGGSITAHKSVLESVSPFFEKMFNFESTDKHKDSVILKRCSSTALEKITEFMYTKKVKITPGIAEETLDTALFLGLNSLVDACTRILVKTVNCKNCIELLAYSETYFSGEALKKKCIDRLASNIQTLRDSSEFVDLPLDYVKMLCSCDRNLCNDEQLYLAIVKWIKFDMKNREQYISVLLDFIKFEEISLEFVIHEISKDHSLWKNHDYFAKIMEVMCVNWTQQLIRNKNHKLIRRFEPENLYAVVGDKMLLYDPKMKLFSTVITHVRRSLFGYSTFGGKNFFVCGGDIKGKKSNSSNYFSLQENCWKPLPPMEIPRFRSRAITLNNQIYVCGGTEEKTVEIFDINESKWTRGPSFDRDMACIGLCLHNDNIYGVQGSSIQFIDTRTQKWISLPSLSQNKGFMYSAVNYKDYIYGFAQEKVSTFDIRANKWLEDVTMYKKGLDLRWSCMIDDEIYVFTNIDLNGAFMLNAYKAKDFSENICLNMINLEWKNYYCNALFSL